MVKTEFDNFLLLVFILDAIREIISINAIEKICITSYAKINRKVNVINNGNIFR